MSYPVAMVLLTLLAFAFGGEVSSGALVWGGLCGISQAFGVWWFYAALGSGPISVVSPLTAILVAGVPVVAGVALGERPSAVSYVGIAVALVAVVLVSREVRDEDSTPHRFTTKVAWLTVGSGLAFGLNFVLIDQAPTEARLWPLVFARVSASALVLVIAMLTRNLVVPSGVPLWLALLAGLAGERLDRALPGRDGRARDCGAQGAGHPLAGARDVAGIVCGRNDRTWLTGHVVFFACGCGAVG